ncbi:hypothetical protein [Moorena producens]|uniref:hypothetical protein n=1 Tax=Moorena producens TaxID=1155739 RepID=UPI003C76B447
MPIIKPLTCSMLSFFCRKLNIATDLEICDSKEVLGELRNLYPKEALRKAAELLADAKREVIKSWVVELNG